MLKHVDREIEYRMAKWLLRNLEKHELVTPAEIEKIWSELIEIYAPPTQSIEVVGKSIRGKQNG